MDSTLGEFVYLWAVIDPVGTLPVFLAVTARHDDAARRRIAVKSVAIAAGVLLFFVVGGQLLLDAMEIPLAAFQIAGGVILFLFAITMIFGPPKPEAERKDIEESAGAEDVAVFPLAIPSLAGPGAMMAAVLLTDKHRRDVGQQVGTSLVLLAVLGATLVLFLLARRIQRWIGSTGASIVSRVMGLILAAVAARGVLEGIRDYFRL